MTATVHWTADRMLRHVIPDDQPPLWRDPTATVSIIEVAVSPDWIGRSVTALEQAAGARTAYLMRFGLGMLPTASTVLQDGDQVYMLVTDDIAADVRRVAAGTPQEGRSE